MQDHDMIYVYNLNNHDLQKPEIANAASEIDAIPEVRAALLKFQQNF